ncbi:MAG: hypothetical protein NC254_12055 [bacterium]|nr:hypothetical protein [bacterium]
MKPEGDSRMKPKGDSRMKPVGAVRMKRVGRHRQNAVRIKAMLDNLGKKYYSYFL